MNQCLRILLTLGLAAGLATGRAPAADYTSPTLGTRLDDPRDLETVNIRILQESPLPGGLTLLEVAADLQNLESALWSGVLVGANKAVAEGFAGVLGTSVAFGQLAVDAAAAGTAVMHVVVSEADAAAARAELLGGALLTASARTASGLQAAANAIAIEELTIVHEGLFVDGRRLILFTVNVRNAAGEVLEDVVVNFLREGSTVAYDFALGTLEFAALAAHEFRTAPGAFYITADAANLATLRADLLSGERVDVSGTELYVFNAPPKGIDEATETAWESPAGEGLPGEVTLTFAATNPYLESLQAGDLLVEDPGVNRLMPVPYANPFDPFDNPPKVLANYLPLEVVAILPGLEGRINVVGRTKQLLEVVKSATFFQDSKVNAYDAPVRDPYDPLLENTYTAEEAAAREVMAAVIAEADPRDGRLADLRGMTSKPWHFNEVSISPKVKLTGEVLLRSSGLKLEVKIRNFQLERAIAHIDAGVVMNLVLECEGNEDTSELGEAEKSEHLFDLPLPAVPLNIGGVPVQIAPLFYLDAGVEANFPQSLTLPLQSSFTVGMELGWERSRVGPGSDGFFYEPVTEFIPIRVSDPTVFDEASASVGVWAELGVGVVGSVAPLGIGERGILNLGPSISVKASADFTVAPLADPWWALDFDIDLTGNFAMDILGETLIDANIPIHNYELAEFDRDAGGPLINLPGLNDEAPSNGGIRPLAAENVRWGRLFQPRDGFGGFDKAFVTFAGPDNGITAGGESRIGYSTLARFSPTGELVWAKDMGVQKLVKMGASLADGSVITAGVKGFDLVLSKFDPAGNRPWVTSLVPALQSYAITDLVVARDGSGQPTGIFVCGYVNHGLVNQSDPFVAGFDPSGNLVWSQYYALSEDDEVHGMVVLADGNLLLGGRTDANVAAPTQGTPDSENVFKDATSNGLLMKLAAADGAILWAHAYPSRWGMVFEDVVEAPDGLLYAGGAAGKIVTQDRPVNLFAKFKADGTLIDHVLVGDDPDVPDELTNGGNSPYDTVSRLVWSEDGLIACGDTGLGQGRAGWVMGLTEELGVKFYSIVDGGKEDNFLDIAAGPDGIAVVANTYSIYPWGSSGTQMPLLLKLPWEGLMRFHPDTAVRTLVLRPQVFHSSASAEFQMLSRLENPGVPPQTFSNAQSPVAFTPTALTWSSGGSAGTPTPPPALTLLAVEAVEAAQIANFDDWAAYHNLIGTAAEKDADDDDDGLLNVFEAFFGRNPHVAETEPVMTIAAGEVNGQQVVVLEFNRSTFSQSFGIRFEDSETLDAWLNASGLTEHVQPLNAGTERVRLIAAQDVPRKFYRVAADLAGVGASSAAR